MAARDLTRRVADLERASIPGDRLRVCFAEPGESYAETVARRWPEGLPPWADVLRISWMQGEAPASAQTEDEPT